MTTNTIPVKKSEYKSISSSSRWVQIIFAISVILALAAVISGFLQSQLLNEILNGGTITEAAASANDAREGTIGIIQSVVLILGIIVFLMWVYRASKNLHSLEKPRLKYSPGWAVGWFFVPFASLFQPYKAVAEVYKASNPEIDPNLLDVEDLKTPGIVKWWWAFFLISNFLGNIASRLVLHGDTVNDLLTSTYAYLVSDAFDIIGLFVTIMMVRQISQSQEIKFQKLNQASVVGT
jgi:heme/copper-type cytochrome/quinol oxidase subunit 2